MASATDLLQKVGIQSATTLDSNYTVNDTTVTVISTSGWPTDTGITFAMDEIDGNGVQVPGTYNEFVGTVATATSITNVDYADGTGDRNYTAGATTRVYIPVSKTRENRIVDWGIVQHKQDGTHANTITTDTINENTAANGVTVDGLNIKDSKLTTSNSVVTANITDLAVTPAKVTDGVGWKELGRTTLSGAGDVITVGSLTAKKYLQVVIATQATGGTNTNYITFNTDTTSTNYNRKTADNNGANTDSAGNFLYLTAGAVAQSSFITVDILNIATQNKLVNSVSVTDGGDGAVATKRELTGQWEDSTNAITSIEVRNDGTGDYAIGSEVVVYGRD